MQRKLVYVLIDGVGDRPDPRLGGLTPLEAARTPVLDGLARTGVQGLVYPVERGIAPESDVAVLHMLGYKLLEDYPGRGVVEAIGAGLEFMDGDLALRGNLATVSDSLKIIDRRAGRDVRDEEARQLVEALNKGVRLRDARVLFRHTVGHRVVVHIRSPHTRLSSNITNTDPAYQRVGGMGAARTGLGDLYVEECKPLDDRPETILAASIVNEVTKRCYEVLRDHPVNKNRVREGRLPANIVLMRDASDRVPRLRPIRELYGVRMACIADMPVEIGIAKLVGMEPVKSPGVADYEWKARKTLELLEAYDGVYVHLKGPDEPGHDGLPEAKKESIEEVDNKYFKGLVEGIDLEKTVIVVSGDHSTPCQLKSHSDDPVPLLVSGAIRERDNTARFTEAESRKGALGVLNGYQVIGLVVRRYVK